MKNVLSILALAAATSLAMTSVQAQTTGGGGTGGGGTGGSSGANKFRAVEVGALESPPNASPGWGIVEIDVSGTNLLVDGRFQDLMGTVTDAHVHCCTSTAFTGDAGIAVPFSKVPTGVSTGSWKETIDLSKDASFDPAFLAANGGSAASALTAMTTAVNAHEAYVNIHTTTNPNGEIRGWLVAAPIPEPATWAMLGVGLAGLGFMARRRVG
jgi:hypothetical protein